MLGQRLFQYVSGIHRAWSLQCSVALLWPGGFQHIAGIHRSLGGTSAHEGVELVNEEDELTVRGSKLLQNGLNLSSNSPRIRTCHQRREIER